jgi:hypothetical protein
MRIALSALRFLNRRFSISPEAVFGSFFLNSIYFGILYFSVYYDFSGLLFSTLERAYIMLIDVALFENGIITVVEIPVCYPVLLDFFEDFAGTKSFLDNDCPTPIQDRCHFYYESAWME